MLIISPRASILTVLQPTDVRDLIHQPRKTAFLLVESLVAQKAANAAALCATKGAT
ncbi:MAG: hypothetical protein AAF732_03730 [Pseudomonadota bacterium]